MCKEKLERGGKEVVLSPRGLFGAEGKK